MAEPVQSVSGETPQPSLPAWVWLWPCPVIVLAQMGLKAWDVEVYRTWMRGELGIVENLTVLFLFVSIGAAIALWRKRNAVRWKHFGTFALVMAFGCFFFAGEEASWGQHWLGFEPPESVAERNEQAELNFHNDPLLETVLDQLPRNLLTLAALVGGILGPLLWRRGKRLELDSEGPWGWIWPTRHALPAAVFAAFVSVPAKVLAAASDSGEVPPAFDISAGETKEFSIALFLMVYLLTLLLTVRREAGSAGALAR